MNILNTSIVILAALQLTACSSADTESMSFALQKSGLNERQAICYSEQLNNALDVKSYNYLAEIMNAGGSRDKTLVKARRKFGSEFREAMKAYDVALKECLK